MKYLKAIPVMFFVLLFGFTVGTLSMSFAVYKYNASHQCSDTVSPMKWSA